MFSESDSDLGRTTVVKHSINTHENMPHKEPPRRIPFHLQPEVDKTIDDMLEKGIIEHSSSPWASGVVLVRKKDGSTRFCVDYRMLNSSTVKDAYPLPRIDDSLEQLSGAKLFSTLDLCSGYWQVEVEASDRFKTAFATRKGLFQFRVLPFGLCNAPATFERLMEMVLAGLQWELCLIYLDDIIVFAKSFEDMLKNLATVFDRLRSANLKLKPRKCTLFATEVEYLGHIISEDGVATDKKKLEIVQNWPTPSNVSDVRSFLGFCSYYRRFVEGFAAIAKPLHKLTEKNKKYDWSHECNEAFLKLKMCLTTAPVLAHPDFTKPFILDTDASGTAIGAVLSQIQDDTEKVIAYGSRSLTKSERKYCVTRKELLAVVHFSKYYKNYLYGKKFKIRTDHSSLRWLLNFKNPEGQMARWLEVLFSYDMEIEHRPGVKHKNADFLSRLPCKQCNHCNIEKDTAVGYSQNIQSKNINESNKVSVITEIQEAQNADTNISKVREWLEKGERPSWEEVCGSYFMRSLWSQFNRLCIENELVCRTWEIGSTNITYCQAVVPLCERRKILEYCHDVRTSGHLGVTKTLGKIRQRFYWPGQQDDVRRYVAGCDKCTRRKRPLQKKRAPMQVVQSGVPMERIATDILGELPETENNNKYIVVISDYFTKWTEAFPMPNMEARTVAKILVEEVVARFGIPYTIHSDQGTQYESKLFSEMCNLLEIDKTRTTPYHPKSDGMVERFNQTLEVMLSSYVQEHHRDWDVHLPYVMMAYRAAEHETTGTTPNLLMLGRETTMPLDLIYCMPTSVKPVPTNQWVWELKERIEDAHTFVRGHIKQAILRQKTYHDKKLSWRKFEEGDEVYIFFPQKKIGCSSKLTSFWRGPFTILRKMSDVLYEVNCGRSGKSQVIHCDRIKKKISQMLREEDVDLVINDRVVEDVENEIDTHTDEFTDVSLRDNIRPRREVKRPELYQDFICDFG